MVVVVVVSVFVFGVRSCYGAWRSNKPTAKETPSCTAAHVRSRMREKLSKVGKYFGQAARLMVGLSDYDTYMAHMRAVHPGQAAMSSEEFFRERRNARYGENASGRVGRRC